MTSRTREYRTSYQADLSSVIDNGIRGVSHLRVEDDGEFIFRFNDTRLPSSHLDIRFIPEEWSSYPNGHYFTIYAVNDVPAPISKPLEDFVPVSAGLRVSEAIAGVCYKLSDVLKRSASTSDDEDTIITDVDEEDGEAASDEDNEEFEDFEFNEDNDDIFGLAAAQDERPATDILRQKKIKPDIVSRIRRDFRAVRKAGFKVGRLCGFDVATEYSIVSLSVRVDKLCLSAETLQAWDLSSNGFVVLLIRYEGDYSTTEEALDRASGQSNLSFRLRKCSAYKPTIDQAVRAFTSETAANVQTSDSQASTGDVGLSLLGIGETIDQFMGSDFISMLKLKLTLALSWDAAKKRLASMLNNSSHVVQQSGGDHEQANDHEKLPSFLARHHAHEDGEKSLPLIAAQFAMRYFVRCMDYCMVCHQLIEGNFEALKPYVCGNALCLFQYMNMGCGPSIDHEIISQPNVVDLLISFCYASLKRPGDRQKESGIREFPTGIHLQVPNIRRAETSLARPGTCLRIGPIVLIDPLKVQFDRQASTVVVDVFDTAKVREGQWVAVVTSSSNGQPTSSAGVAGGVHIAHHARIEGIIGCTLTLRVVSRHVLPSQSSPGQLAPVERLDIESIPGAADTGSMTANMVFYNQNLDDISDVRDKAFSMTILLSTVPPIATMRAHLMTDRSRQIERWKGLSPSAAKLLRWIIASNRSYIVQVGECPGPDAQSELNLSRQDEKISGVDGWVQFRFAQGSPEKEMLFQEALKHVGTPQRTLVAWHGSPLYNWHSIIRQGLDFKYIHHGRAYGHGVYFAKDFNTSALSYTGSAHTYSSGSTGDIVWPNSALGISAALSLNELINKPGQFTSAQHFFVVQHIHWIQCRYLFVKTTRSTAMSPSDINAHTPGSANTAPIRRTDPEFVQDPAHVATGPSGPIFIPRKAIPSAQVSKQPVELKQEAVGHSGNSGDEDESDLEFLSSEGEDQLTTPRLNTPYSLSEHQTDFRPGALDLSTLPQLNPPSYATDNAQKIIGKEIAKLQKIQSQTRIHELGWFIDFEKITNMFRWIVELHSFDPKLPLAQDMKKVGVKSIVLEIRFGRDYPLSPPFVRVIRPRFLPFMQGGGGHVTAGGAMCMELLTNSGWSPVSSLEGVLLQVRMAMSSTDPKPARLENSEHANRMDYGIGEAFEAFTRAANVHGWKVSDDLRESTVDMVELALTAVDFPKQ
ncbi:uncharacterized protein BCR38DRAFT_127127 [Pseudomassariella vexata]|uniref:UBC core domain-containing protein n=1 Tax=Pseudomassariella vexata TaxID=1141098 RepID=A0A1Y2D735_9PEZI|nr:uncharacterized protein BCR38DRAFT_127127 [Pseudomassariella vexata]ORY55083.1 hypothetical protein BCR38DRAFT_127127 [Pseudomassariella vexata]